MIKLTKAVLNFISCVSGISYFFYLLLTILANFTWEESGSDMFILSVLVINFFVLIAVNLFLVYYPSSQCSKHVNKDFEVYTETFFFVSYYAVIWHFDLPEKWYKLWYFFVELFFNIQLIFIFMFILFLICQILAIGSYILVYIYSIILHGAAEYLFLPDYILIP